MLIRKNVYIVWSKIEFFGFCMGKLSKFSLVRMTRITTMSINCQLNRHTDSAIQSNNPQKCEKSQANLIKSWQNSTQGTQPTMPPLSFMPQLAKNTKSHSYSRNKYRIATSTHKSINTLKKEMRESKNK